MLRSSRAIASRFSTLLQRERPSPTEIDRARTALKGIRSRLATDWPVVKATRIGSHAKGTAIRRSSDLDLLVVFRREALKWGSGHIQSGTLLGRVQQSLQVRYPYTEIRRDGQAVVVGFGAGRYSVDVVPGVYYEPGPRGYPIYAIPDGSGGWIRTAPDLESAVFQAEDKKSGGKLSRLVRLSKIWCHARVAPIPLSNIYVERLLLTRGTARGPGRYSTLFAASLRALALTGGRTLTDPLGVSGMIPIAKWPAQAESTVRSIDYSRDHALAAVRAELRGDTSEAIRQWRIVFNDMFPARPV